MKEIIQEDAINWLKNNSLEDASFVASMPDFSEFPEFTISQWEEWFENTATLILNNTALHGVAIFYQSDIKHDGVWIDKGFLCQMAAKKCNAHLLWHKIICRVPAGKTTFGRPAYTHILCFSKKLKLDVKDSTPDVIEHVGEKVWERGMGLSACIMIAEFLKKHVSTNVLVNPFCGKGSMISVAEAYGINVIGIERGHKRALEAAKLKFDKVEKKWH